MKRSKSSSPQNSFTMRRTSSTWSILASKRNRKGSPVLTRQVSASENLLADINKLDSKGRSLLFLAARCDQPEVAIQLLNAGCNANLADSEGNTPLHEAAECGHVEVVNILLKNGRQSNKFSLMCKKIIIKIKAIETLKSVELNIRPFLLAYLLK